MNPSGTRSTLISYQAHCTCGAACYEKNARAWAANHVKHAKDDEHRVDVILQYIVSKKI